MTPIPIGFSGSKKFCAETFDDTKVFLRIGNAKSYSKKWLEHYILKQIRHMIGDICAAPIALELSPNEKEYFSTETWIEGDSLGYPFLPIPLSKMNNQEQRELGIRIAKILKKLHNMTFRMPANSPESSSPADIFRIYAQETERQYKALEFSVCDAEILLSNIKHLCLIEDSQPCLTHGDLSTANIIWDGKDLRFCDWENVGLDHPWRDFTSMLYFKHRGTCSYVYGCINEYFNNNLPPEFWKVTLMYISIVAVRAFCNNFIYPSLARFKGYGLQAISEIVSLSNEIENYGSPSWWNNQLLLSKNEQD